MLICYIQIYFSMFHRIRFFVLDEADRLIDDGNLNGILGKYLNPEAGI
jgi:hypothetical protein